MPAKKKAAAEDDEPAQEEEVVAPDMIPTADEYDPAKHANHSHLNP